MAGFLLIISILFAGQQTEAETIRMGYFPLPPHAYIVKGKEKPQGASIVYFEMLASRMGYDIEWIGPLPLPRLIMYLAKGMGKNTEKLDGTIHFPKNDEMQKILYYPDQAYYQMQAIFVVKADNPLAEIRSINDIRGYRVGLLQVPVPGRFILENQDELHLERIPGVKWGEQNLKKLLTNRVDAVYDLNQYSVPFEAIRLQIDEHIKVLSLPEPTMGAYVMFAKTSGKGKILLKRYNSVAQFLTIDYHELIKKEFAGVIQNR